MKAKEIWYSQRGWLRVKVCAEREEDNKKIEFEFDVYVEEELSNYDVLENIDDLIRPLAHLKRAYRPEIIDVSPKENDDISKVKQILEKYRPEDYEIFYNTVEMLCEKGVGNGCYQDYTVLVDVVQILAFCEEIVQKGGAQ